MQQLNNLTDDANQLLTFTLLDGSEVQLTFVYRAGSQRWTMDVAHDKLTLFGVNLVVSPNLLRPWKNVAPFGIAVLSDSGLDPSQPTDFLDGTVTINMLSAAEVAQVEDEVLIPEPLVNP